MSKPEQDAIRMVAEGVGPREIAARLGVPEESVYRLVTWVLDEVEPAPAGRTVADVHAEQGSRAASAVELDEFHDVYGPANAPDHEG